MTDNIEKKVAVDGPVANEGEHGSSPFSPGQVSPADPLGFGQRWTVAFGAGFRYGLEIDVRGSSGGTRRLDQGPWAAMEAAIAIRALRYG